MLIHIRQTLLIIFFGLCACSPSGYRSEGIEIPSINKNTDSEFALEKELVLQQDSNANFDALRQTFTGTSMFRPWDDSEHKAGLVLLDAQADKDYELCITFGRAIVKENYTSLLGHFGIAVCGFALGYQEESDFHKWVLQGLINSIQNSGDGKSAETAFVCNSPTEMRDFVRMLGLQMFRQEYQLEGTKQIEVVYAMDTETTEDVTLYFDTSASRLHSFKQP